ncbi:hypothetical protein GO496_18920 [Acidovorax citrulli]|nr:hypothetical protein [Paracidovorax citrulli]
MVLFPLRLHDALGQGRFPPVRQRRCFLRLSRLPRWHGVLGLAPVLLARQRILHRTLFLFTLPLGLRLSLLPFALLRVLRLALLRILCALFLGLACLLLALLQLLALMIERGMRLQRLGRMHLFLVRCLCQRVLARLRDLLFPGLAFLLFAYFALLGCTGCLGLGLHVQRMLRAGRWIGGRAVRVGRPV